MKLIKACIALAAFAALFVVPSMASAALEITHPTGERYQGAIEATNVTHSATIQSTRMTTSLGEIECASATLTGTLVKNDGTNVEGEITTAEFGGTPGKTTTGHCTAPGGLGTVTVTPSHTSALGLPWCLKAESEDRFSVRGGKCGSPGNLNFVLHSDVLGACSYTKASVSGTVTTHPADLVGTINGQEFTKSAGSVFCPGSGKLDMAFTLFVDGKPTTPVFLDK